MFSRLRAMTIITLVLIASGPGRSLALDWGSDGLSGALNPSSNLQIDLSLAVDGNQATPGNPNGVYDPAHWAIIFKYSSVNIPPNVTVTFKNHRSGAPVIWLVQGNVTINGQVSLNGAQAVNNDRTIPGSPGPGGFQSGTISGAASGPGGSGIPNGPVTAQYASVYGNTEVLPLVGGSGSMPAGCNQPQSGGGGGGAILIASNQTISLPTAGYRITANGGGDCNLGSGGAIRLLADAVTGSGLLQAYGGSGPTGLGRIRIEANSITIPSGSLPSASTVSPLTGSELIFPAPSAPTISIQAINGQAVSVAPNGEQSPIPDVSLTTSAPVTIDLVSTNIPSNATVSLRVVPRAGTAQIITPVPANGPNAWRATGVVLPASGVALLQATAVLP